jgi:plasmid stability protein
MPGFVIKELPAELHRKLKEQAKLHHRSMTKEAISLLEQALNQPPQVREPPAPYKGHFPLTESFIDQAKREGRE